MLAGALFALVVIAGPGDEKKELSDAAKRLRVAWASQYEWREDGLKNVTLNFSWDRKRVESNDDERLSSGTGQAVVVGNLIKRVHVDGGWRDDRTEVAEGVRWVLERYVRQPFEEAFRDVVIKDAGKSLSGAFKVSAADKTYYIKNDRIIAELREIGSARLPREVRVDFKLDDMGDGYARLRELYVQKSSSSKKLATSRTLRPRSDSEVPMPASFVLDDEPRSGGTVVLTIKFEEPTVDVEHPVVMDKNAAEILREAWLNRYTLPDSVRVVADFDRRPDKALGGRGWQRVEGELQVWGMDQIEVELAPEKNSRSNQNGRRWRAARRDTCERHIREAFGLLRGTSFEEEFKGCGFELAQDGARKVINVYGFGAHVELWELEKQREALSKAKKPTTEVDERIARLRGRNRVSFLVERDYITGYRRMGAGDDGWTYLKLKKERDGRGLIIRLITTAEGTKLQAKWSYYRAKGLQVPKKIEMLVTPSPGRDFLGVCAYNLKKIRVSVPKN